MTTANLFAPTLAAAVQTADLAPELARRILAALTPDDVKITVTEHHDGFVPMSYGYKTFGDCTTTVITAEGATSTEHKYDRRRSNGVGAKIVVTIARPGQKRGRLA